MITVKCEDTDECALGHHNCDTLGPGYHCLNMQGTFRWKSVDQIG